MERAFVFGIKKIEVKIMAGRSGGKIDRLIKLLYYLSIKSPGGGATLNEMAEKCGVSERQVYRDIGVIENTDTVKLERPGRGMKTTGRYKLLEAFPLKIGPEAAAVIFLSILRQRGGPLAVGTNDVKDLLVASLYRNRYGDRNSELQNLHDRIHVVEEKLLDEKKSGDILLKIVESMRHSKAIRIKYFKTGECVWVSRKIHPYGLGCKHNTWYLVGYCCDSQGLRTFRLDCIEYVSMQRDVFKYPPEFNLREYFGDSWGVFSSDDSKNVLIKVSPQIAYRFNLIAYHPSQQIVKDLPNGSIIVSFRTSGMYEFTGWLLQLAEFVEVLEPAELRQMMKEKLGRIASKYI
ncbi:MAG: WYL domain-containing protein [Desulfitobacterium hafniense]|nr:WYL domain-containing protein [Desulfitobacterium hafniense]